MLHIEYDELRHRAVFRTDPPEQHASWFIDLRRLLEDFTGEVEDTPSGTLNVPWWAFLPHRAAIGQALRSNNVARTFSPQAYARLQQAQERVASYGQAGRIAAIAPDEIQTRLPQQFVRSLTREQLRNVGRIAHLPAAATFSVPGAGKTTEALAYFFLTAPDDERLLVVAPTNAFGAWDQQMEQCVQNSFGRFVRLTGGRSGVERLLATEPRFMIVTYDLLARTSEVVDMLADHMSRFATVLFLDESHRIKGAASARTEAVLRLSCLPQRKLILSGTPMPQDEADLVPQFNFLYPEVKTTAQDVVQKVQPIFVRTTKDELGLPEVLRSLIKLPMRPAQRHLYGLMKYEVARQAEDTLNVGTRQAYRALGRSIMRLMQVVSNPALLVQHLDFAHEDMLAEVLAEGDGPKVEYAVLRARQLAAEGRKTLVWTTFRRNVEIIATRLVDLGALHIHGGVNAGSEEDEETREGKIKVFHDNANCMVLVANPAAAAEAISLHRVCRNAVYVDRSYNAAHYLQSEDRIHRLGLAPDQHPIVEIVECDQTIDQSIRQRLHAKIDRMSVALNDPSLRIDPIVIDPFDIDLQDAVLAEVGLDPDDVRDLVRNLRGESVA